MAGATHVDPRVRVAVDEVIGRGVVTVAASGDYHGRSVADVMRHSAWLRPGF
jgi:hypothetical protein